MVCGKSLSNLICENLRFQSAIICGKKEIWELRKEVRSTISELFSSSTNLSSPFRAGKSEVKGE
jgi:hypothetical protein